MSKGAKTVLILVAVLALAVAVFAALNRENIAEKKAAQEGGTFLLRAGDQDYTVSLADIQALSPVDITANYKKSGQTPEEKVYQGVSFQAIVESLELDTTGYESVAFIAADGYASALPLAEAMDADGCYIVTALGGEPLGTKEGGGSGPFMMILPHDMFSQRWCKFLLEVGFK